MERARDRLVAGSDASTVRDDPQFLRAEVEVCDFALITYVVPAERLAGRLPRGLELQTFETDGRRAAFVSASCFLNRDLRWAGGPSPRMTAHQSTYRTYVTRGEKVGSFFFSSYVGTALGTLGQKLGLADTRRARFTVDVERQPDGGYRSYSADIVADDGHTHLRLVAEDPPPRVAPFRTPGEHVRFITHRLHGFSYSVFGFPLDAQVEHAEMSAFGGRLVEGHFPPLTRLGLVHTNEQRDPHSVLVAPGTRFELLAPIPLLGQPDGTGVPTP